MCVCMLRGLAYVVSMLSIVCMHVCVVLRCGCLRVLFGVFSYVCVLRVLVYVVSVLLFVYIHVCVLHLTV